MTLWHASSEGDIVRFEPRVPPNPDAGVREPVVWAVAESHLTNFLVPRDCPRVVIRRGAHTHDADVHRFFGPGSPEVVVFIEAAWFSKAAQPLWLYELPSDTFTCVDANAGHFVSSVGVSPTSVRHVPLPLVELLSRGAELRVVPRLRPLAEVVAASSLAFSIIRLRNALP